MFQVGVSFGQQDYVPYGGLEGWGAVFWQAAQRSSEATQLCEQLMMKQDEGTRSALARSHPQVQKCYRLMKILKSGGGCSLHPYLMAHMFARHVTSFSGSRKRFDVCLEDTATSRAFLASSRMLPELQCVDVQLQLPVMPKGKLAPQLAVLRRYAGPYKLMPSGVRKVTRAPPLNSVMICGSVKRARSAHAAATRLSRMLRAVNPLWLSELKLHCRMGDVGLCALAPSLVRLTALTELAVWGMHSSGAAALAGVLQCLARLLKLDLMCLQLPEKPSALRVEGALSAAIADLPWLQALQLETAKSARACTACSAHILSCLHRCRTLRELNVSSFEDDRSLCPPDTSHLTQLTCLRATLVAVHDEWAVVRAATWLTRHLAHMSALQQLELEEPHEQLPLWEQGGCRAATDAEYRALAAVLPQLQQLTELKIVRQGVVSRDALSAAHAALSQLQKLHILHLDGALGSPASSLWAAMVHMASLQDISLHASSAECAQAVAEGVELPVVVKLFACESKCGVQDVFVQWGEVTSDEVSVAGLGQAIASLLQVCPNAVHVTVAGQHVSDEDGFVIAPVLQLMPVAAHVTLPLVVGSGEGLKAIVRATVAISSCRILRMGCCRSHDSIDHLVPNTVWQEVVHIWLAAGVKVPDVRMRVFWLMRSKHAQACLEELQRFEGQTDAAQ